MSVTQEMLQEIRSLQLSGKSLPEVIDHLRQMTVPAGYSTHTWTEGTFYTCSIICDYSTLLYNIGMTENTVDKLCSVLAQSHYSLTLKEWNGKGVPFQTHWYVLEVDPITGKEREDHAHLFKVYPVIY